MTVNIVAVDLGGTNTRAAHFKPDNPKPSQQVRVATRAQAGPEAVIAGIIDAIEQVMDAGSDEWRIGVAAPGPIDPRQGVVFEAPNLPGWENVPLQKKLEDHFGVAVALGNDANLAALGEWRHGAGQGSNDLIYLTISTGVGGGVITDGRLLLGAKGIGAEMGHIVILPDGPVCGCGQRGHLEALASGTAIARAARERLAAGEHSSLSELQDELTAARVGQAAQQGDKLAGEIIQQAAFYLGQAMADFCHIFNPDVFILGGGVTQLGGLLFDPIRQSLDAHLMNPIYSRDLAIKPAALGDDAGLVGAMVLASQQ